VLVRCLFGDHARLAALYNYIARVPSSLDCCAAGTPSTLIHFVALSLPPCGPLDPFSPPTPHSYRLLRQSPPSNHFNDDLNPTLIYTVAVASCAHSPNPRSHLSRRRPGPHDDVNDMPGHPRHRLPARASALKSASVPPNQPINHAALAVSSSNKSRQHIEWLPHRPDHCPIPADFCDNSLEICVGRDRSATQPIAKYRLTQIRPEDRLDILQGIAKPGLRPGVFAVKRHSSILREHFLSRSAEHARACHPRRCVRILSLSKDIYAFVRNAKNAGCDIEDLDHKLNNDRLLLER
jgi:hypothetical protein